MYRKLQALNIIYHGTFNPDCEGHELLGTKYNLLLLIVFHNT